MKFSISKASTLGVALLCYAIALANVAIAEVNSSIELEQRFFVDKPIAPFYGRLHTSAKLELEYFRDWNNGNDTLTVEPFIRYDSQDDQRSHVDFRQFQWTHFADDWELTVGLGHVFWGVTESQHLVDIVNQTDQVENIDGEDKLGQPMIRYQYYHDLGNFDFYLLPAFRPRTFAGENSRLTGGLIVDPTTETYETKAGDNHIDLAARYSRTIGDWGLGLSWFKGTSREPDLVSGFDPRTLTTIAHYPQIEQIGLDVQLTTDAWLVKLEAIQRDFDNSNYDDYSALTTGFEYTFTGVFGSIYDLGILGEYSWDERNLQATSLFQNDLFFGARWALNNIASSELLFGVAKDLDYSSSKSVFIEASTRIGNSVTANLELRYFSSDNRDDLLFRLKNDSFIQLGFEYFFD